MLEAEETETERDDAVVVLGPREYARVSVPGTHTVMLPFTDYARVVARRPDTRSADTAGLVAALTAGMDVLLVTGVGVKRQQTAARVVRVEKWLRGGAYARLHRMSRLALRVTVEVP